MTRSRRAGLSRDEVRHQPLYARVIGLQYLAPGGFLCFVFLEGAVALGILLALAELVSWWGVLVLPMLVAVMVKLNDVVAGMLLHPATAVRPTPVRPEAVRPEAAGLGAMLRASSGAETVRLSPAVIVRAPVLRPASSSAVDASALNGPPVTRQWTDDLDDRERRARQSAARRYQ